MRLIPSHTVTAEQVGFNPDRYGFDRDAPSFPTPKQSGSGERCSLQRYFGNSRVTVALFPMLTMRACQSVKIDAMRFQIRTIESLLLVSIIYHPRQRDDGHRFQRSDMIRTLVSYRPYAYVQALIEAFGEQDGARAMSITISSHLEHVFSVWS